MNTMLSTVPLLIFLAGTFITLAVAYKRGDLHLAKPKLTGMEIKIFLIPLLAISSLLILRIFFGVENVWPNVFLFALSFAAPFFARRAGITYEALKVLLLLLAACLTLGPASIVSVFDPLVCMLGLLAYKLLDNLSFAPKSSFDDILPACIWLTLFSCVDTTSKAGVHQANVLATCLSISLLLSLVPASFIANDKYFIKRLAISATAAITLLLILGRIVLLPNALVIAVLYAAGLCFNYFFSDQPKTKFNDAKGLLACTRYLVGLGILTLAASRLVGGVGLVALASTCVLGISSSGMAIFAGFFWLMRLVLQAFISGHVSNVTGINLMHSYCSAALYFGLLAIFLLSIILRIDSKKWLSVFSVLCVAIVAPLIVIYLIHEESAASFFIAANVAAIALIAFSPFFFEIEEMYKQGNLIMVPLAMVTVSSIFSELVTIGNEATIWSRLQTIICLAVVFLILYFIVAALMKKSD